MTGEAWRRVGGYGRCQIPVLDFSMGGVATWDVSCPASKPGIEVRSATSNPGGCRASFDPSKVWQYGTIRERRQTKCPASPGNAHYPQDPQEPRTSSTIVRFCSLSDRMI